MTLFEKLNKFSEQFEITKSVREYVDYTIDSWYNSNSNDLDNFLINANTYNLDDFLINANTSRNILSSEGSTFIIFDNINNELVKEDINVEELKDFINQWFKDNNLE